MGEERSGKIRIRRVSELFFHLEPVDIYIDGKRMDLILSGDEKEFEVDIGEHLISIRREIVLYGTFTSNKVIVEVSEDGPVLLECGSNYQGIKVLLSKFCILNKNDTFYIKEATA
jgi:hypothetical protein